MLSCSLENELELPRLVLRRDWIDYRFLDEDEEILGFVRQFFGMSVGGDVVVVEHDVWFIRLCSGCCPVFCPLYSNSSGSDTSKCFVLL